MANWGLVLSHLFPGAEWELTDSSDLRTLRWLGPRPANFSLKYVRDNAEQAEAARRAFHTEETRVQREARAADKLRLSTMTEEEKMADELLRHPKLAALRDG